MPSELAVEAVRHAAQWFEPWKQGVQPIVDATQFKLVAVEADWPDAYRANRTRALQPLEWWAREEVDVPETYPTGV